MAVDLAARLEELLISLFHESSSVFQARKFSLYSLQGANFPDSKNFKNAVNFMDLRRSSLLGGIDITNNLWLFRRNLPD